MALFTKLSPKPKHAASGCCLLLDVSGSMGITVPSEEPGFEPRRIDLLFKAVKETPECAGLRAYAFSTRCQMLEVIPADDYEPHGGTDLALAFDTVKNAGFFHAILVTDGEPDSPAAALQAALGMKLGIIYIGNPPVPSFLEDLAKATDGTFAIADMRSIAQLEEALIKALPAPETPPAEGGGTIKL